MVSATARARHQQRVEELCAAVVRALGADPALHFRNRRLYRGSRPYPATAPHLRPDIDEDDFGSFRGAADGLALRRRLSDAGLHRRLRPADAVAGMVFDMLEQFRVESLVSPAMPGAVQNLRHRHRTWSAAFRRSGLTETHTGLLLYTLAQVCRSRLTGEPIDHESDEVIEAARFVLAPVIGGDLEALRRHRLQQQDYAVAARSIAEHVAAAFDGADDDDDATATSTRAAFSLVVDPAEDDETTEVAASGDSRVLGRSPDGYRVFTRDYDREQHGSEVARPEVLRELRDRLDHRVSGQGVNLNRLSRELRALLADPRHDRWEADREEGQVDGRRLARLITSPSERRLFRELRTEPAADCLVTFLMDCSGSMRRHHETLAMYLDVLLRALDMAGVASELLGFTTGSWNGGRSLRDWTRAGRPTAPGRLNERRHLVFKDADTSWRRARPAIAALLRDDLYREGIDGEAVHWAWQRMRRRAERHKVLVVISDGSPMDSATNLANDDHYLDHHLRQVVEAVEAYGEVRVCGLGVGLDLSPFYSTCAALDLDASTGNEAFRAVLELLAGRHRR
jgi:cobaltochelatase CobT